MRIALISLHFAEYAARLALALSASHEVQLHLSEANADAELPVGLARELYSSVEVHSYPKVTRTNALFRGLQIARKLRAFKPRVIHGQEAGDWAQAVALRFAAHSPFVYTVHDPLPHSGNDLLVALRNKWPRRFLRRSAEAIIVHGQTIVPDMENAEPSMRGKVHAVLHGILGESHPPPVRPGLAFIFFGRIEVYKGLDVLLDALDILVSRRVIVDVRIVGRGPDLERHRMRVTMASNVTLDETFVLAEDLPEVLRQARAVVLPYRDATQSGVVANAFAAGVPVIASRVGALIDVLDDGFNALLTPPGQAEALADAISRMVADDDLASHLAKGAAHTASTKLAWTEIARKTEAIYFEILKVDGGHALQCDMSSNLPADRSL